MIPEPTVFVVDDDAAVRDAIGVLFKSAGLRSEGYASAEAFLQGYEASRPGCLVLDLRMNGMDGIELQRRLKETHVRIPIIFLSGHGDLRIAVSTMRAGAVTFMGKPFEETVLLREVHGAIRKDAEARGEELQRKSTQASLETLTSREREILNLIVSGMMNKGVAEHLGISTRTVEAHRAKIMAKLGAATPADLVRILAAGGDIMAPGQPST